MPFHITIAGAVIFHAFVFFFLLLKILQLSNLLSYLILIGLTFGIFWLVLYHSIRERIQKYIYTLKVKYFYLCVFIGVAVFFIVCNNIIPARWIHNQLTVLSIRNPLTLSLEIIGVAVFYVLLKTYAKRIPLWVVVLPLAIGAGWLTYSLYLLDLYHHSAHFVPVSRVLSGIPFSENFRSLYGHFPFFFKPLFMIVPFNKENYDILLSVLIAWSFVNFSLVIDKVVDNKFYKYLGIFILFGFVTVFNRRGAPNSHVLIPLRSIFPSLLLLWAALCNPQRKLYWINGLALCTLSIIFNPETGLFCLVSFAAFYAYRRSFSHQNIIKIGMESAGLILAGLGLALLIYNILNMLQKDGPGGGGGQNLRDLLFPLLTGKSLIPFLQLPLVFKELFWIFMIVLFLFACLYTLGKSPLFNLNTPWNVQDNPINGVIFLTGLSGLFVFSYYMNRTWTYGATIAACQAAIILVWVLSKMPDFSPSLENQPLVIPAIKKVGTIACIFGIVSIFSDAVYLKDFHGYLKRKHLPQPNVAVYTNFVKKTLVDSQTSAAFGNDFWEYAYAQLGKKHLLPISDYSNWYIIYQDVYHNNPIDVLVKLKPQQLFVTDNNFTGFGAYGVLTLEEDRQISVYMTQKFNRFLQDYTLISEELCVVDSTSNTLKYYKHMGI